MDPQFQQEVVALQRQQQELAALAAQQLAASAARHTYAQLAITLLVGAGLGAAAAIVLGRK